MTMQYINAEHTLWRDGPSSGNLNDPHYIKYIADGGAVEDYVAPEPEPSPDPVAKLTAFLAANPDVAALIENG